MKYKWLIFESLLIFSREMPLLFRFLRAVDFVTYRRVLNLELRLGFGASLQ